MPPEVENASAAAKIGPNALTQTVRALRRGHGQDVALTVLRDCNQEYLLHEDVNEMVDEQLFADLVRALANHLGVEPAREVLQQSGRLTAIYLLHHRIPRPFQWLLRPLPPRPALKLLLLAINRHAWTFVGSGKFDYAVGETSHLRVTTHISPAKVACGFYGGTFNHLIHVLVGAHLRLETSVSFQNGHVCCIYSIQDCVSNVGDDANG